MDDSKRSSVVAAVGFAAIVIVFARSHVTAQPEYTDWSLPLNLGPVINTASNESGPALSRDRLSLYFISDRTGTTGSDIFVSRRNSVNEAWGSPVNLGPTVNSSADEATPNVSRDGHWLFFMSRRPGSQPNPAGVVGFDIYVSYREHVHDDFDWQPPVNLGPNVNSSSFDQSPLLFDNDDLGTPQLFFTRTTALTGNDIFVSNLLADGTFGPATPVAELNTTSGDSGASVRFDGLEVFLFSRRPGGLGASDLWTAIRDTVFDPWSAPIHLGAAVNSVDLDFDPHIASDRKTLYFASTRVGGFGGQDLYVTTRTREDRHREQ